MNAKRKIWDNKVGILVNNWRANYHYDTAGNLEHYVSELWADLVWTAYPGLCYLKNDFSDFYRCEELFAYFSLPTKITDLDDNIIDDYSISQDYPNPFNPLTTINYVLNKQNQVTLRVYNIKGQLVKILVNKFQKAGIYQVTWQPDALPSGIYFYRLRAGGFSQTKKLVLQK